MAISKFFGWLISSVLTQDEFSTLVQSWNAQRGLAVERSLSKSLYPLLEKELKTKLAEECRQGIERVS